MSATPRAAATSSVATGRPPLGGVAIVLVAASLYGTLGPLSRFAYDAGMTPIGFAAWRAGIALIGTASVALYRVNARGGHLIRFGELSRDARLALGVAAFMGFVVNLVMFVAFDLVTVALALLGFYTYPVIVAVANVALGHESLDRPKQLALGLATAGMLAVVASQLDPATGIRLDAVGFGFALAAAVGQAVFIVVSRAGFPAVPADQAMSVVLATTVVGTTIVALVTGQAAALVFPIDQPSVLPNLLFAGLFAACVSSMLFLTGIRRVGGTTGGILMLFEPVVGVVLAAVLLGERLTPVQVLGGAAILAAAVILQRSSIERPGERPVAAPGIEGDPVAVPSAEAG